MYSSRTSSTMSFTYPAPGAYRALPRNTEPEVFTFDRLPDPQLSAPRHQQQQQQRRRVARVLYPAKVRKYLPPAEKSPAKRWLLALCLVLLAQIYTERDDELADMAEAAAELQGDAASASSPLLLHFRSAEETARRLTSCSKAPAPWMNMSCSVEDEEAEEAEEAAHEQHHHRTQQRNNPYVVALLYPAVIHTLGSEQ